MPEAPLEPWQGIGLLVTVLAWCTVGGVLLVLAMAQPHSVQGLMSRLLMLVCLPAMWLVGLVGIGTLLHWLAREGWAMFAAIGPWLLLAALLAMLALYPKVQAIKHLPVF
ncbi:hypothetical protein ABB30_07280 [Stenotrophomonas ginsengisoli]|uniref:Transmembrane protein n=1 Tax=Stenotrophomonas ginsengisoli TaxID=336566 RepID=A0A0R0DGD1_9GAMM|nr:hypothetical protein ABB30_07280 [Stenotrophomonas ginsengisoli]